MCVYGAPPTNINNNFPAPQLSRTPIHTTTSNNKQNYKTTTKGEEKKRKRLHTHAPPKPTISHWQTYFSVFYLCFQLGAGHIYDNKLKLQAAKTQPRFVGVGLFKAEMRVLRCCQDRIEIQKPHKESLWYPYNSQDFHLFYLFSAPSLAACVCRMFAIFILLLLHVYYFFNSCCFNILCHARCSVHIYMIAYYLLSRLRWHLIYV